MLLPFSVEGLSVINFEIYSKLGICFLLADGLFLLSCVWILIEFFHWQIWAEGTCIWASSNHVLKWNDLLEIQEYNKKLASFLQEIKANPGIPFDALSIVSGCINTKLQLVSCYTVLQIIVNSIRGFMVEIFVHFVKNCFMFYVFHLNISPNSKFCFGYQFYGDLVVLFWDICN